MFIGNGHDGKMVENNAEYYYFFGAAFMFFVWTILAGILMDEDIRYVGLSLTSLTIIVVFIYILRNVNKAIYLKDINVLQISYLKYAELQDQSLDYREKLNLEKMKVESIAQKEQSTEVNVEDVASKRDSVVRTTKEWKELERVWTRRTSSALLCGKANAEPKFKFEHPQVVEKEEQFSQAADLHAKILMLAKIDKRVDDEIFNNLSSKAYFKGLIMLHIINHKKELTSKIKTILNEMRVLLSTTQYKDQMNKLEYSYFSKMEQQQDYDDFNRMFEEYLKLKGVRLDEIKQRQEEEERKRKEREEKERQILEEQRKKKGNQ